MSNEGMANSITDVPSAIAELLAVNKQLEQELQKTEAQLCGCRDGVASLKKEIDGKIDSYLELKNELQKTREQLSKAEQRIFHAPHCVTNYERNDCDCGYEQYFKDKQGEE